MYILIDSICVSLFAPLCIPSSISFEFISFTILNQLSAFIGEDHFHKLLRICFHWANHRARNSPWMFDLSRLLFLNFLYEAKTLGMDAMRHNQCMASIALSVILRVVELSVGEATDDFGPSCGCTDLDIVGTSVPLNETKLRRPSLIFAKPYCERILATIARRYVPLNCQFDSNTARSLLCI